MEDGADFSRKNWSDNRAVGVTTGTDMTPYLEFCLKKEITDL